MKKTMYREKKIINFILFFIILFILLLACNNNENLSDNVTMDYSIEKRGNENNLIKNGSFEKENLNWASDWHKRALFEDEGTTDYIYDDTEVHSGKRSIQIRNNRINDVRIFQYVNVKPHTVYKISAWIKAEGFEGNLGANISILDSGAHSQAFMDTYGKWEQVVFYGFTGKYQTKLPVALRTGGWGGLCLGTGWFDDISMEIVKTKPAAYIHSFTFDESYDQVLLENYFIIANDKRYQNITLPFSLFFLLLFIIAIILFTLYSVFLKGKNKMFDNILKTVFTKYFVILLFLLLVVFFITYLNTSDLLSVFDVQISFLIVLMIACGVGFYLYKNNQLTPQNIAKIIIVLGIALRLCYFLYTAPVSLRQHDLWAGWGHTEYIKYIADFFRLPPVGSNETYHPPLHYILSAVIFKIIKILGFSDGIAYCGVELLIVFFSSLFLIFVYKILRILKSDKKVLIIGTAFACFLPSMVYMSVYLNNDTTLTLFYTISFYFLLKWVDNKTIKNTIIFAIFTALAMLAKKSALIMYPIAGIVFLVELIKDRKNYKKYIHQGIIFILIAVPIGFSFQIRNYFLFQQGLAFSDPPTSPLMPNSPFNLFYVSVENLLKNPFVANNGPDRVFVIEELIRTALFSVFNFEFSLEGIRDIGVVLMFLYLINLFLLVLYFIFFRKENLKGKNYILLINLIISIVVFFQMRLSSPYHATHEFRYLGPFILISLSYFLGKAFERFLKIDIPVLRFIIRIQFIAWCLV